jgi:hypothetical protein
MNTLISNELISVLQCTTMYTLIVHCSTLIEFLVYYPLRIIIVNMWW